MPLASFIKTHREQILEAWEKTASSRAPRGSETNFAPLRDHLGELLDAIARDLDARADRPDGDRTSEHEAWKNVEALAEKHGAGRAYEGITLTQMVPEFLTLRSCATRLWIHSEPGATDRDLEDFVRFDEALDHALMHSVTEFMDRLNQSRETFLGILSHDLRNPLATMIMAARLMLEEDFDKTKLRDMAERIVSTGQRMDQLVSDLLDFTRTRVTGKMPIVRQECDLGKTVRNVADEFSMSHPNRTVNVRTAGGVRGEWDEKRMSQAVGNLLGNALHHGAPDAPITVSAEGDEKEVAIAVHNEGEAISDETRDRLFEPLTGVGPHGTKGRDPSHLGLGLYIAKAIVSGHGGHIDVDSSADGGTTFKIHLPRTEKTRDERQGSETKPPRRT
jgi:signal transduction histidine kinase